MPELAWDADTGIRYYPHGTRLIVNVCAMPEPGERDTRSLEPAASGERGRVVAHRLDETQLIVNLVERDSAVLLPPPEEAIRDGFLLPGVGEPLPIAAKPAIAGSGFY